MKYYYMNKEHGHLLSKEELLNDAIECGYDDIIDPCSCEYGNWQLHYALTNYVID